MSDMRLIVAGAGGRMGRVLVKTISQTKGAVLTGALEAPGSALLGEDAGVLAGLPANGIKLSGDLWELSKNADGVIDFTVPAATIANVAIAAQRGLVHVIGTTGLSDSDDAVIKSVTSRAIVVKSGNMSLGVNVLAAVVRRVAKALDEDFDIEVLEMHHKMKIDAPSGTALMLGEAAAQGRGVASCAAIGAGSRRAHRRTAAGRHRLRHAARRHRGRRPHGDLRRCRRADRTQPQGRRPRAVCERRREGGPVGEEPEARLLLHGRRARSRRFLMPGRRSPLCFAACVAYIVPRVIGRVAAALAGDA